MSNQQTLIELISLCEILINKIGKITISVTEPNYTFHCEKLKQLYDTLSTAKTIMAELITAQPSPLSSPEVLLPKTRSHPEIENHGSFKTKPQANIIYDPAIIKKPMMRYIPFKNMVIHRHIDQFSRNELYYPVLIKLDYFQCEFVLVNSQKNDSDLKLYYFKQTSNVRPAIFKYRIFGMNTHIFIGNDFKFYIFADGMYVQFHFNNIPQTWINSERKINGVIFPVDFTPFI